MRPKAPQTEKGRQVSSDPAASRPSNFERGAADADIRITNRDAFGGAEHAGDAEEEPAR
jgi:hypothetical protein